jgi:hypothetical protein
MDVQKNELAEEQETTEKLPDIKFTDHGMGSLTEEQAMMFQPNVMIADIDPVGEMIDEL